MYLIYDGTREFHSPANHGRTVGPISDSRSGKGSVVIWYSFATDSTVNYKLTVQHNGWLNKLPESQRRSVPCGQRDADERQEPMFYRGVCSSGRKKTAGWGDRTQDDVERCSFLAAGRTALLRGCNVQAYDGEDERQGATFHNGLLYTRWSVTMAVAAAARA